MRRGLIVYLMGKAALPEDFQPEAYCRPSGQEPDDLQLVVSRQGGLELDEAWHYLCNSGCDPIHLLVADPASPRFRPLYPLVRLGLVQRVPAPLATLQFPGGWLS